MNELPEINNFPNHLMDPEKKKSPKYFLQCCRSLHESFRGWGGKICYNNADKYKELRDLANGNQSIDQYKPLLGVREQKGKLNVSYRNIDWSINKVAPKIRKVLLGKLLNQKYNIGVKLIDSQSINEERQKRFELQEAIINKPLIEKLKARGIPIEQPQDGIPMPENTNEIDQHMKVFYKPQFVIELKDKLAQTFANNKWEDIEEKLDEDLTEIGIIGTRTYIDSNGQIKIRHVKPENLGVLGVRDRDFDKAWAMWEYVEMTISDLKQLAGNQLTESQYQYIAENATGETYGDWSAYHHIDEYTYPYDKAKIMVMDAEWLSVDRMVHQVKKNRFGNKRVYNKPVSWLKSGEEVSNMDKYESGEREIIRTDVKNKYKSWWVVGTKYVFGHGLATNMPRQASSLTDTELSFKIKAVSQSPFEIIETDIHDAQINWLQYQNHIAKSVPPGAHIEVSAFDNITMGKKGGKAMDPLELISMYFETGIMVYRINSNNSNLKQTHWKPIEEHDGSKLEGALKHLEFFRLALDRMKEKLGLNDIVDASTPRADMPVKTSEIALLGTNNALSDIFKAKKWIHENTARACALLIPDAAKMGYVKGETESLGRESYNFWVNNSDISYREASIVIEHMPDEQQKQILRGYIQQSLKQNGGYLEAPDALAVEREMDNGNLDRAEQLLLRRIKERKKQAEEFEMSKIGQQEEANAAAAERAAAADIQKMQQENALRLQLESELSKIKIQEETEKFRREMLLEKIKQGHELTVQERELANKLLISREDNASEIEKTRMLAKSRSAVPVRT